MKPKVTKACVIKSCAAKLISKKSPGSENKQKIRVIEYSAEMTYVDGDLSVLLGINGNEANGVGYDTATWSQIVGNYAVTVNEVYIKGNTISKIVRKNNTDLNSYTIFFVTEDIEKASILSNYIKDTDSLASIMLEVEEQE